MKKIVVGIILKDKQILIVKRLNTSNKLIWAFPGGKVEDKETLEEAIKREVLEETGITCEAEKYIGNRIHPNTKDNIHYFACNYVSGVININTEEIVDIKWVNIEELDKYFTTNLYEKVIEYLEKETK